MRHQASAIQLTESSFAFFLAMRRRWKVLYAPRTLLKGFSPHEMHDDSLLGWLLPTIRASEFTVLQLVGLDATVLLGFFKMGASRVAPPC